MVSDARRQDAERKQRIPDILLTRIEPPSLREGLINRTTLVECLETTIERQHRLILLSAPAGFGKTTLLLQWLHNTDHQPIIWLTLDPSCNAPLSFLHYLKAAVGRSIPDIKGTQAMGGFLQPPELTRELTYLINRLAQLQHPIVLVFDDYQTITEPAIEDGIKFLIDNAPPCLRIVIASRIQPTFSLARLRTEDACTVLHTDDLRFDLSETTDYFQQANHLSSFQINALHERTEGWIAGLQLARSALSRNQHIDEFIDDFTGSHRFVMDYLTSEVLEHQSTRLRNFLLQTSILSQMNARLCAAVTGYDDSAVLLDQVEQANLFLVSLDSQRYWYRYHHLFAELLQHHLLLEQPDQFYALHRRAGEWYLAEGHLVEGVNHLLTAGEHERATTILTEQFMEILLPGEEYALRQCLVAFPADYVLQNDGLCLLWACVYTLELQPRITEQWLKRIEASKLPSPLYNLFHLLRGIVASAKGSHVDAENHVLYALHLVESQTNAQGWQRDTNHVISLIALSMLVSLLIRQRRIKEAEQCLQRYFAVHSPTPHRFRRLHLYLLASIYWRWGELQYNQNHLNHAETLFLKAIEVSNEGGIPRYQCLGHLSLSWVMHAQRQPEQVEFHLERAWHYSSQDYSDDFHRDHIIVSAQLLLLRRQTLHEHQDDIFDQLDLIASGINESSHYDARVESRLVMALRAFDHHPDEAQQWLERAYQQLDDANGTNYDTATIRALLLDAALHERRGQQQKALQLLDEALKAAAQARYILPILDMGAPVVDLLRRHRNRLTETLDKNFTRMLFDAIRQILPPEQPTLIEPLTPREQEILELIATDHSNQAIATNLVISIATVKWHISNIYSKLGVANRLEAVNRARKLRLLPAITPTWEWVLSGCYEVSYLCNALNGYMPLL